MRDEPVGELSRLRVIARKLAIGIRTQRRSRTTALRAYSLIDLPTGKVICKDLQGLSDVRQRLWWIVRDRKRALWGLTAKPKELCPTCQTLRAGYFRWCTSCGLDYEGSLHFEIKSESLGRIGDFPRYEAQQPPLSRNQIAPAEGIAAGTAVPHVRMIAGGAAVGYLIGALVGYLLDIAP